MANTSNPTYAVNTAPYFVDLELGALATIMDRQFRFCSFECLAQVAIECGVFATISTDSMNVNFAKQLSGASDKIFGVTFFNRQRTLDWDTTLGAYKYPANEIVSLIEEGDLIMYAEKAVDIGDPVYTRYAVDTGLTRIGALSNAAGTGLVAVPGAKFVSKRTNAGKVKVSLPDII